MVTVFRGVAVVGVVLGATHAHAETDNDIARLTIGRLTNPEKSIVLEVLPSYQVSKMADANGDAFGAEAAVEYGLTDRLTLSAVFEAEAVAPRSDIRPDHIGAGARYLVLDEPVKLAASCELNPSISANPHEAEVRIATLYPVGSYLLTANYESEIELEGDGVELEHSFGVGMLRPFGMNGILGVGLRARLDQGMDVTAMLGGRINEKLFLGLATETNVVGDGPALTLALQLHLYFGAYQTAGLE